MIKLLGLGFWGPCLRFFWFGLWSVHVIIFKISLARAQMRSAMLIEDLVIPSDRIRSLVVFGSSRDDEFLKSSQNKLLHAVMIPRLKKPVRKSTNKKTESWKEDKLAQI